MAGRRSRAKTIVADQDSECFSDLRFKSGVAYATFAKDGAQYSYEMSRADWNDWAGSNSLGQYFNKFVR